MVMLGYIFFGHVPLKIIRLRTHRTISIHQGSAAELQLQTMSCLMYYILKLFLNTHSNAKNVYLNLDPKNLFKI